MKSVIALFAVLAVASVATADFAVELTNDAGYEATFAATQYTVQIIQNDGQQQLKLMLVLCWDQVTILLLHSQQMLDMQVLLVLVQGRVTL